jgi:hypothetical protein
MQADLTVLAAARWTACMHPALPWPAVLGLMLLLQLLVLLLLLV